MLDVNAGIPNLCPIRGIKTGPWEPQGYPNFSGTAAYAADVDLPESIAGKRVLLNAGKVGNLLEVEINGHVAGIRAWEPYTLDITPLRLARSEQPAYPESDQHHAKPARRR